MKKVLLFCCSSVLLFYCLSPVFGQEATPSSEEKVRQILEAVKERIRERQLEPRRKAYVGTLKTIADSTLILETKNGVKQAKVSTEAAILRLDEKVKKEVKFEDLVIGELTIAMGYLGENEVLEAKRILVSETPPEEDKREALLGIVEEVDLKKKTILVKPLKKESVWTLKITKKTEIAKKEFEEIEPGDRLVAAGAPEEEENLLATNRVHILLGKTD